MILLVWSLVSSALEAARRREIANFLRAYLEKQKITRQLEMLIWKSVRQASTSSLSVPSTSGKLAEFKSESNLDMNLVFHTSLLQVFAEKFETLRAKEWRFFPKIWPTEEDAVYFIATEDIFKSVRGESMASDKYFELNEKCDKLAVSKTRTEAMYSCTLDKFVEVIDAYSEGLLVNEHCPIVEINSMFTPPKPERSTLNGSFSKSLMILDKSQNTPLPILQQLFYGDSNMLSKNPGTFRSELTLHSTPTNDILRGVSRNSARRRNRSCISDREDISDLKILTDIGSTNFVKNLGEEGPFSYNSLPRYIRQMNSLSNQNSVNFSSGRSVQSVEDDFRSIPRNFDFSRIQSVEDAKEACKNSETSVGQPLKLGNFTPSSTLDSMKTDDNSSRSEMSCSEASRGRRSVEMRMIDDTDTETIDSTRLITTGKEHVSFAKVRTNERTNGSVPKHEPQLEEDPVEPVVPVIELNQLKTKPPVVDVDNRKSRRSTSVVAPCISNVSTRRFSAITNGDSDLRHRSYSPSYEYFQSRSLRRLAGSGRDRTRPSLSTNLYTPRRNFLSQRNVSTRAMAKPPSVLVYTGEDERLYDRIRKRLSTFLPVDEITVFHVSIEALKKQPWIEPTTVCMILASTKNLDDEAWTKMQVYFNHSGKLIFVCQNKLLASMSQCESTKQQKSLKSLPKNDVINETFHSKDVSMSSNFSVVLKKEKDAPLLLYMHNHGAQHASALFSDATTDQLIAPNNTLLKDCLESVGVKVSNVVIPKPTGGVFVAEYDSQIEQLQGVRYGEEVGSTPKVFMRKSELVKEEGLPTASAELLPIEVATRDGLRSGIFDFEKYYDQLACKIGQFVLHVPVATTTMDVCASISDAIPSLDNVVVIADSQVKGRGRGGNEWISPAGVAMFTFSHFVPKTAKLAGSLPVIQHVFCVALVDAIRRLSKVEDFPLRIKWPNDLYYERSHKVGGVLVTCKTRDDGFRMSIGAGINVANQKPTICLNDMLPAESTTTFCVEEVIAETLNRFRYWTMSYEQDGGVEFHKKHREMWLHTSEEVLLEDLQERVVIRGIDAYGYLEVRSRTNPDKIFSIGDDGNTFDMMKGLIRHKY